MNHKAYLFVVPCAQFRYHNLTADRIPPVLVEVRYSSSGIANSIRHLFLIFTIFSVVQLLVEKEIQKFFLKYVVIT